MVLLFSVMVIAVFLPKGTLFQFEYHLGQPWKHDKLIAPFDFGIRKDSKTLSEEMARIEANHIPVFSIENAITETVLHRIDEAWLAQTDSLNPCDSARIKHVSLMTGILQQGIVRQDSALSAMDLDDFIYIDRQGTLEKVLVEDALKLKDVVETVLESSNKLEDSLCEELWITISNKYILSNAIYNDSLSKRMLETELSAIIKMEGKVGKGQQIIDQGEVVDQMRFNVLESLKAEYEERTVSKTNFQWSFIGALGIVIALLGLLMLFVYMGQEHIFNDPRPITLALTLVTISFAVTSLAHHSDSVSVYAIPIGITPLLMRMFFDFRVSIFSFFALILINALFSANALEYILLQAGAISFATMYQSSSIRRSRMLGTAFLVFLGYSVFYVLISLAQNGSLETITSAQFGWFAINGLLCMMVFPLIYVVEKVFGYISETTLLELSDSNQPLLKALAMKAPGTFQHSIQVANLAEKLASKIGGNTVLLRTAALYHDIGKMNAPQFFIENQMPDNNPHDDLEPDESAAIIIEHVHKGIEMARKENLPFDIIQFIQTHHGTSRVKYFLKRAQEKGEEIDLTDYTYPGPKPNTKEQAILMMADAVEAASRSLKHFDYKHLEELVDKIIDQQLSDGQFEDAPVTFKDISAAKVVLKNALRGIYHQRISYE